MVKSTRKRFYPWGDHNYGINLSWAATAILLTNKVKTILCCGVQPVRKHFRYGLRLIDNWHMCHYSRYSANAMLKKSHPSVTSLINQRPKQLNHKKLNYDMKPGIYWLYICGRPGYCSCLCQSVSVVTRQSWDSVLWTTPQHQQQQCCCWSPLSSLHHSGPQCCLKTSHVQPECQLQLSSTSSEQVEETAR